MKNFKYPLAISGTREELEALIPKLEGLGYKYRYKNAWGWNENTPYLLTFFAGTKDCIDFNQDSRSYRTEVPASNPELVLALAAMTTDEEIHVGEVVSFDPRGGGYSANEGDLAVVTKIDPEFLYVRWISKTEQKDGGYCYRNFSKTDKDTIISHFAKQENMTQQVSSSDKSYGNRKITGYKFKPGFEKFEKPAANIAFEASGGAYDRLRVFDVKSVVSNKLEEAGVLDLWFEPVYEEEKKVITVRSEGGFFEVEVGKQILFEGKGVSIDYLKNLREKNYNFNSVNGWYVIASHFNIGCKKSIPYEDIKKIIDEYNRINNIFDDFDLPF